MHLNRLLTASTRAPIVAALTMMMMVAPGGVLATELESGPHADEEEATIRDDAGLSLAAALEAALSRAPGAYQLEASDQTARALEARSQRWLAGAPSAQLRYLDDRAQTGLGVSEVEGGIDVPLWRWGQRDRLDAQAQAQRQATQTDSTLRRWALAGQLREIYWQVRIAQRELTLARAATEAFRQLENDVARRIQAGDAAAAEQLTAEGQRREREATEHEAEVMVADRYFAWRTLTGLDALPAAATESAATPPQTPEAASSPVPDYPPLRAALVHAQRADAAMQAARAEGAGPPRLLLSSRRDTQDGAAEVRSLNAQLSLPFGGASHRAAALAPLNLEAARAQDQIMQQRQEAQLAGHEAEHELHARTVALDDASRRMALAEREIGLARRAYTLGESSLAERLLAEIRALDAQRTQALAELAYARAIARYNQIHGVLP